LDFRQLKQTSLRFIQASKPNPCLVTLAVLAYGWLSSYITQRINGMPFELDLNALENGQMAGLILDNRANVTVVSSAFLLALQAAIAIVHYGYLRYCLCVVRGEPSGYRDLLYGFEFPLKAVLLWAARQILAMIGYVLLIVPGIIVECTYCMAFRLLCDHPDWGVIRCLRESRSMMRGRKWEWFCLHLSFLGWYILTVFPVLSIFVDPYVVLTESIYYQRLTISAPPDMEPQPPNE
jgi:hypothetical protein